MMLSSSDRQTEKRATEEDGTTCPQAQECPSPGAREGAQACPTLSLGFWPPGLRGNQSPCPRPQVGASG